MDNITARLADEKDIPLIHAASREAYGPEAGTYTYFVLAFKIYPDTFVVAEYNGEFAGYISATYPTGAPDVAWGVALVVLKRFRGLGISKEMFKLLFELLRNKGAQKFKLNTDLHGTLHEMYQKIGFNYVAVHKGIYGPDEDRYEMEIEL